MDKVNGNHDARIGFYVCHCGHNIAAMVDCTEVAKYVGQLPGVVLSRDYKYMCSDPGQELIQKDIKEFGLNRIVVASCSPLLHEHTFRSAVEAGGLNPFFFHNSTARATSPIRAGRMLLSMNDTAIIEKRPFLDHAALPGSMMFHRRVLIKSEATAKAAHRKMVHGLHASSSLMSLCASTLRKKNQSPAAARVIPPASWTNRMGFIVSPWR